MALSFSEFLNTPPGILLSEWEKSQFNSLVAETFGAEALQIGATEIDTLSSNLINSKWYLFEETPLGIDPSDKKFVCGITDELPFETESMDLVTLPHTLDMSLYPQKVLREAVRVLRPQGRIIITAFNSLGLWWLKQRLVRFGLPAYLPSKAIPISLFRIKDWMQLLGLEIDCGHFGVYQPGFRSETRLKRWDWMNKAGDRWAPELSNVFILSATKQVPGTKKVGRIDLSKLTDVLKNNKTLPLTQKAK